MSAKHYRNTALLFVSLLLLGSMFLNAESKDVADGYYEFAFSEKGFVVGNKITGDVHSIRLLNSSSNGGDDRYEVYLYSHKDHELKRIREPELISRYVPVE